MAELAFEYLLAGLEAAGYLGTPIDPPTHYLNLAGTLTPQKAIYRPPESRGKLAEYYRSKTVRKWSAFEAEGGADVYILPLLLNALVKGGVDEPGDQPADAVLTQLWTFAPTMDDDDLLALTLYWGDPNVQAFQAAYGQIDTLTLSADASGTDGVSMSISGQGYFPSKTAPASVPTMVEAPLLAPGDMQLWIDSGASAIGTTEIVGRVVSAEVTIPSGIVRKWLAAGPGGDLQFQRIGRQKRHAEMRLVLELTDTTQYDQWVADTALKARLRMNGSLIESVGAGPTSYYHYVEVDMYGKLQDPSWGEFEGTNRTLEMTLVSEYDSDAGCDFAVKVQSDQDEL
jgi:hypothetical protein